MMKKRQLLTILLLMYVVVLGNAQPQFRVWKKDKSTVLYALSEKPVTTFNTNKALVHCEKYGNKLLVTSCIDNLLKGAVGQAVQNMNIMFGIDETAGLRLKASAF